MSIRRAWQRHDGQQAREARGRRGATGMRRLARAQQPRTRTCVQQVAASVGQARRASSSGGMPGSPRASHVVSRPRRRLGSSGFRRWLHEAWFWTFGKLESLWDLVFGTNTKHLQCFDSCDTWTASFAVGSTTVNTEGVAESWDDKWMWLIRASIMELMFY